MAKYTYNGYNVHIQEKGDLDVRLLQLNNKFLPLSQIISEEGEVVSITNCSYFFKETYGSTTYYYTNGRNQGDLHNDIYVDSANGRYCDICIYEDGSWYAGKFSNWDHTENYRDVENGVCAGFSAAGFLILNGEDVAILSNVDGFNVSGKFSTKNPQTAFAILSDGNMLQIVSEGRNSAGDGLTGYELRTFVKSLYNNISVLALLDGGGSSEMIVNGKLQFTPSDGKERSMYNGLAFVRIQGKEEPVLIDINETTVSDFISDYSYTGLEIKPSLNISYNDITLVENTDYTLVYQNNINIGTGKIIITGINNFNGSVEKYFTILPLILDENNLSIKAEFKDESNKLYDVDNIKVYYKNVITRSSSEKQLVENQDYILEKENLINKNTLRKYTKVSVIGKGNYSTLEKISKNFDTEIIEPLATGLENIDRKPGYTYIQYNDSMSGLFNISSQGKSAMDELNTQLYNHAYSAETITLTTIPIYHLEPNTRIYVDDPDSGISGEYIITRLSIPLGHSGMMSITATKAAERIY